MISKIYNSNQILFNSGSRKGKLREEIELKIELMKDKPDATYIKELKRIIDWKKPKKKKLTKEERRNKFLKSPQGRRQTRNKKENNV